MYGDYSPPRLTGASGNLSFIDAGFGRADGARAVYADSDVLQWNANRIGRV